MSGHSNALKAVVILGALLSFAFLQATVAKAAVPPCPAVPDAFTPADPPTDTDPIVSELRELRREQATTCDAIRAAGVDTRDAVTATDARGSVNDAKTDIVAAVHDIPAPADSGTEDTPAVVKLANSSDIQENAINAYNAMREVMWLIAGLLVATIVVPMIRRVLFP